MSAFSSFPPTTSSGCFSFGFGRRPNLTKCRTSGCFFVLAFLFRFLFIIWYLNSNLSCHLLWMTTSIPYLTFLQANNEPLTEHIFEQLFHALIKHSHYLFESFQYVLVLVYYNYFGWQGMGTSRDVTECESCHNTAKGYNTEKQCPIFLSLRIAPI